MFVGGVIDNEVDDHADAALLGAVCEFDKIAHRPEGRIDGVVVGNVVAIVLAWRLLKRHQPDGGDAQAMQVVETPH